MTIRVNKRSWHYRLLRWLRMPRELVNGELPPRSFCSYVGELMAFFLIGVGGSPIWIWFVLLVLLVEKIETWHKRRMVNAASRSPGFFVAWMRAKKDKICPMIEWEE